MANERPCIFFQFSDMGSKALFSNAFGFECIDSRMSNPIVDRFSSLADRYLRNKPVPGLYCHCEFLGKEIKKVNDFSWYNVNLSEVVGDTKYPEPMQKLL